MSPAAFFEQAAFGHLDAGFVRRRFPGIAAVCGQFNLDIATDRIPVRPGAHYMIGGVTVDSDGYLSVDYSRLTPLLIEAIKQLKQQNEELSKRLERVEQQLKS